MQLIKNRTLLPYIKLKQSVVFQIYSKCVMHYVDFNTEVKEHILNLLKLTQLLISCSVLKIQFNI